MAQRRTDREQLAAEYALLSQLLEDLRRRIDLLNSSLNEIVAAKKALEEVQKLNEGEEILMPLGAGIYVRARLANKSNMMITIGANIMIERSPEEAQKTIEGKEQEVRDALQRAIADYQVLVNRLRELEQQIRSLSQ